MKASKILTFLITTLLVLATAACASNSSSYLPDEYNDCKLGACSVMIDGSTVGEASFEVYADGEAGKTLTYADGKLTEADGAEIPARDITAAQFKRIIADTIRFFDGQLELRWSIYLPNIYLSALDNVKSNIIVVYSLSKQDYMKVDTWETSEPQLAPVAFMSLNDPTGLAGGLILICE